MTRVKRGQRVLLVYLSAWCPKGGAGVQDEAKFRDKERLIVSDETDSFYNNNNKRGQYTLFFQEMNYL